MTGPAAVDGRAPGEAEIAAALRLRPATPKVTRLSRKALIVLGTVAGMLIASALIVALQTPENEAPPELYNTESVASADGLLTLPRDYASVPQLGPPLPGELGRPILSAQERGQPVPVPAPGPAPATAEDPAEQLRLEEMEEARTSRLFVATETRAETPSAASVPINLGQDLFAPPAIPAAEAGTAGAQDRMLAFLDAEVDRRTVSGERVQPPAGPYTLQAGAVIPAALLTGIRSDLPGQIIAQVTEHVRDSPTGRHLLIPQGSRLIGQYDSRIEFGQSRVLLVWTRMIFPNGRSIVLEREPGADVEGYAGLEDGIDYHWGNLFRAALISTLLGAGAELGADDDEAIVRAIRDGAQDTINQAGQQIVRRHLDVEPTLTIRPGFPVRVIVTRDLVLEPYRDQS